MLKLENVTKIYYNNGVIATGISKVSLELNMGEFVVITGESGSGKSTLLNVISGIDSYEEGEMYINGQETSHYTEKDFENYRKRYIANIFQNFNLVNSYTVYQNIELILLLNGYKKKDVKRKVLDTIQQVGLSKFRNTKISKLSGGQKQRVAIARAIVKDTPIIVADEPTGNLDETSANEIIEILNNIARNKLVIIVTHNIEQVEKYATKIIKMHDGKIMQNICKKNIKEILDNTKSKYKDITTFNKYRLGIRNTFNIFSKFILLFMVFSFISLAFLTEYSGFKFLEDEASDSGYSMGFSDISDKRILIKKQNNKSFSQDDYANIKKINNVDYIVEDDLFIDGGFALKRDDMSLYGNVLDVNNFRGTVDIGELPKQENEIVLKIGKKHFYITNRIDDIMNKTFSIADPYGKETIADVTIVGVQYSEKDDDYNSRFYMSNGIIKNLRGIVNKNYSNMKILLNNRYVQYNIITNENVKNGCAFVDDELKYQFKNYKILSQPIDIEVENIYYTEKLQLSISKTYIKSNFTRITGLKGYENYKDAILINPEDYNTLFNKESYQSSVYVIDTKNINDTMTELENIGLIAKKVTDYKVDDSETYKQIIKMIKYIVTIAIIIVLFFIAYLIIKIILKSRKLYFTTLRMLGATYKSIRKILDIELFVNSSLSYIITLIIIYFTKYNVELVGKLVEYLTIKEYLLMYVILIIISKLISRKFCKRIFKNTAINTYNEEM